MARSGNEEEMFFDRLKKETQQSRSSSDKSTEMAELVRDPTKPSKQTKENVGAEHMCVKSTSN